MQTLNNLPQVHEKFAEYMDSCTIKEYQTISKILKEQLGWSRTTLSNKRTGRSPITRAEQIAIQSLINRTIF